MKNSNYNLKKGDPDYDPDKDPKTYRNIYIAMFLYYWWCITNGYRFRTYIVIGLIIWIASAIYNAYHDVNVWVVVGMGVSSFIVGYNMKRN